MPTPTEGRCQGCRQTRPLFAFSWVPTGWYEFTEAQLCCHCHSNATIADERDELSFDAFGEVAA
ncbi:hypothetical protein [Streptomyces sp. NPDC047972]|uniref:hypothetical protein n=1 Tax=Streptomyces sp. NPDC047972 TaxID=3365493 RepID=UPI00371F278A